jgi:hypothetical protein
MIVSCQRKSRDACVTVFFTAWVCMHVFSSSSEVRKGYHTRIEVIHTHACMRLLFTVSYNYDLTFWNTDLRLATVGVPMGRKVLGGKHLHGGQFEESLSLWQGLSLLCRHSLHLILGEHAGLQTCIRVLCRLVGRDPCPNCIVWYATTATFACSHTYYSSSLGHESLPTNLHKYLIIENLPGFSMR